MSLKQILLESKMASLENDDVEVYKMIDKEAGGDAVEKTIIVKRMDFMFDENECHLINFTDLTAYKKLQKEEDTNRLLKTLNASVHHEMLVPTKTMIDISKHLIKKLKNFP